MRGKVVWEGDHLRLVLTATDSKGVTKEQVSQISSILRKIGCRCVLDEPKRVVHKNGQLVCSNRFEPLSVVEPVEPVESDIECSSDSEHVHVDLNRVRENVLAGKRQERKLRVGTWNFSGLCSERKQKEVGELLKVNNIDVVAGQESWENEDSRINVHVDGYKWFGKPRDVQKSQRGEGGIGFLVRDCLVNKVEFVGEVKYAESVWMKVRGERGRSELYIRRLCIHAYRYSH